MALDRQPGLMDIGYPVLWIQDRKNGGVGGGFMTTAGAFTTKDINYIAKNTIPGAGIKPDNTTLVTSIGYQAGDVGKAAIINSPTSGTDNQLSKIVLPVGEYYIQCENCYAGADGADVQRIRNVTDGSDDFITVNEDGSISRKFSGYLTVSGSTKEFRLDVARNTATDNVSAKGAANTNMSICVHLDMKIYKIG
jgi:hypothetical protein